MGLRRRSGETTKAAPGGRAPLTARRAKRLVGVGTAVAPLLAPYALAAAGAARAAWDAHRAGRLGVAPDELTTFSGRGGALHARISHIAVALDELDPRSGSDTGSDADPHATGAARRFAADTRPRLADLAVAVRAAEQMPGPRRRVAHRAVAGELDGIETTLLGHLGISS